MWLCSCTWLNLSSIFHLSCLLYHSSPVFVINGTILQIICTISIIFFLKWYVHEFEPCLFLFILLACIWIFRFILAEACCGLLYLWFPVWLESACKDRLWCEGNSICWWVCCHWHQPWQQGFVSPVSQVVGREEPFKWWSGHAS